jgi:predicted ATPase
VPSTVASAIGFVAHTADLVPSIVAFLQDKSLLIILDSCEHLIDSVAHLAERIHAGAPDVHLLATSREALRVEGERVFNLDPLSTPPTESDLDSRAALAFPAVQLFVERVTASGVRFELTDEDAPIVAEICRNLDGIPLAIELAAGRVSAYGVGGIATLIGDRFGQLLDGRRTTVPRHQTLGATLDWSYELLTPAERLLLQRLAIFVGPFTVPDIKAITGFGELDEAAALGGIGHLVSKSLVAADFTGSKSRYRLLDTTRSYVRTKLAESGELEVVARRHALHYLALLDGEDGKSRLDTADLAATRVNLGNLRAALNWSFSEQGDPEIGTALAAAATPVLVELSLLSECSHWAQRGIDALSASARGTRREVKLQAALGHSLMFTEGNSHRVRESFSRGVELSREMQDHYMELKLLGSLHLYNERIGNYHGAVEYAERSQEIAEQLGHPAAIAAAGSFLGLSQHLVGNHQSARSLLNNALLLEGDARQGEHRALRLRLPQPLADHFGSALLAGRRSGRAAQLAKETIEDAGRLGHPVTMAIALIWGITVYLWVGDQEASDRTIRTFLAHGRKHSLNPYNAVGLGYQGELLVQQGEGERGACLPVPGAGQAACRALRACDQHVHDLNGSGPCPVRPAIGVHGHDRRSDPADRSKWRLALHARGYADQR